VSYPPSRDRVRDTYIAGLIIHVQGSHWADFNSGHLGAQERRDPAIARAAWNTLERALAELSNLTARLREHWGLSIPVLPFQDRRMGSFSLVGGRRTEMTKPIARKASAA
jgi:hypothetical protein